jgi:hypothetical protein
MSDYMSGMLYPEKLSTSPEPPTDTDEAVKGEIAVLKERALKCKVIALDKLNKSVLSNPTNFNKRDKGKVLEIMTEWFSKDDEEIDKLFNAIIIGDVLDQKAKYEEYSVDETVSGPLPPPIKKDAYKENAQHLAKPDDWVDPYPSKDIDPAGRSTVEIFSKNEVYEADYNEVTEKFDIRYDDDGNKRLMELKTQ